MFVEQLLGIFRVSFINRADAWHLISVTFLFCFSFNLSDFEFFVKLVVSSTRQDKFVFILSNKRVLVFPLELWCLVLVFKNCF